MDFLVLGPIEVRSAGERVPVGGVKQRSILALLVAHRGQAISTDRIAEDIYGEDAAARARRSVQSIVSMLRHEVADAIVGTSDGYLLDVPDDAVDAVRFGNRVSVGLGLLDSHPEQASVVLREALELWRGAPYADVDGHAAFDSEIVRLNELHSMALEARIEADLACGKHRQVIPELEALVSESPLHENLWGLLMIAQYRSGRQADALRAYQSLRAVLGEQLGIEPSLELRELEEQVLLQDPTLDPVTPIPSNLPNQLTSFVGRQSELTNIATLLADTRLVTLVGTGGSGKTRLAIELATNRLGDYPDGVWFVDLRDITEPDEAPMLIASTLRIPVTGDQPLTDQLALGLPTRRLLLILDNCEHVLDAITPLVDRLIHQEGHLHILATSRQSLGIPGEPIMRVNPLSVPRASSLNSLLGYEAVRLFSDRAHAARPGFNLDEHAQAVQTICESLDGLPLALELAAARLRMFSPEEVSYRLSDQMDLLRSAHRTGDVRHATIEATIRWSWDLLDANEQDLFRQLSVFRGPWTIQEATEICAVEPVTDATIADLVSRLVDQSLVVVQDLGVGATRYRLLEPVRQFAARDLDDQVARQLRNRTVGYWSAKFADSFDPRTRFSVRDYDHAWGLQPSFANLTAAVEWAFELERFEDATTILSSPFGDLLVLSGAFAATCEWVDTALAHRDSIRSSALGSVLVIGCGVASAAFRNEVWRRYAELGVEVSATTEERQWFEIGRAVATNRLGHHDDANAVFNDLINTADSPSVRASSLIGRAQFEDPTPAWESMQQALDLCSLDSLGWWDDGVAALMIGEAAYDAGHYREALGLAAQSLDYAQESGWLVVEGHAAALLAVAYAALGRIDEAASIINEAARKARRIFEPNIATSLILRRAAGIARLQGDFDAALGYAVAAKDEAQAYDIRMWLALATLHVALIARDQGDLIRADDLMNDAVAQITRPPPVEAVLRGYSLMWLSMYQATIALRRDQPERAMDLLRRLLADHQASPHEDIVQAVDLAAVVFGLYGPADVAARLMGAIDGERERTGLVVIPPDRPIRERAMEHGRDVYVGYWNAEVAEGRGMNLEEAVELAASESAAWLASRATSASDAGATDRASLSPGSQPQGAEP